MVDGSCHYYGCEREADVRRLCVTGLDSGDEYAYCKRHDPFDDDEVADLWRQA